MQSLVEKELNQEESNLLPKWDANFPTITIEGMRVGSVAFQSNVVKDF